MNHLQKGSQMIPFQMAVIRSWFMRAELRDLGHGTFLSRNVVIWPLCLKILVEKILNKMDFREKTKSFRQLLLQYSKLKVRTVLHCQTIAGYENHQSEVVSGSHDEVIKVRF